LEHEMGGHREVAVEPFAGPNPVVARTENVGEAPDGDPPPRLGRGKEAPVADHVPDRAVGDVVRGEREAVDTREKPSRVPLGLVGELTREDRRAAEVAAIDDEVHRTHRMASRPVMSRPMISVCMSYVPS